MSQTLEELAIQYQVELDDYKLRFFTKWGYQPTKPETSDFRFLNDKKQKMCVAFWNHKDVTRCVALIEALSLTYASCKLIRAGAKGVIRYG